ncbi:hypothetical protein H6P81_012796 [Aristolochia fimbriata]|uniref:Pentatricopeptide repeat-containing protein n=1 Tax=Aristolochia fimbriata TaxID=158543 RepID=A0AAV7ED54_ARIFI|nr:hypothetical protein H6P81_012796 [Aristolochia fimbriata]
MALKLSFLPPPCMPAYPLAVRSVRNLSVPALLPSSSVLVSVTQSPNHIFLPHLEEPLITECESELSEPEEGEQREVEDVEEVEEEEEDEEEEEEDVDPFISFFKSRPRTDDPEHEGRLHLQKNRRTSWHIAKVGSLPDDLEESQESENECLLSNESKQGSKKEGVVDEILQIARNLLENVTLGDSLGSFKGRITQQDCHDLLSLMGEEGLVLNCLYLFEWMGLQEPSLVTPRAYSILFPLLGRAKMGEQIMILFRNLPAANHFKDLRIYNAAISGLSSCGRYNDAWSLFEIMQANNILPDHVTCSIMITIMRKSGQNAKEAWEFFERMNCEGMKWNLEVVGALIKSFCEEGLMKQALIIQTEMEKKGISSNTIIYNTLLDAYSKSNQVEEAEGLFIEMKERGLKPTVVTYNILMDAYSRRMQPEIIEELMLEMRDLGLEPNVKSYTCLISGYGRQRNMSDKAADAFLRMKKVGIKPTSYSYTALIHAYSVSGWHEKAYLAFENMRREGIKPAIETYTALLDAFRRTRDAKKIIEIWKLMMSEKITGTRVTFNILLDGLAKQGHYIEARDVIFEFGKMGLEPNVMTYNMLINAYGRGGQHSKLPQLLKEMAVLNLKPDSVTYSTMIYAYVRVRDFKRAFYFHKQMVKSKQVPDARSYQKLRAILEEKTKTKNRRDRSAILGILHSSMGLVKPKRGKKDEFWKNKKKGPRYVDSKG